MKTTIQDIIEAHELVSATVRTIFDHELSFKREVLGRHGWNHEDYVIERCHAARNYRLTLKHDDGREKDLYIPSNDVLSWVESLDIL